MRLLYMANNRVGLEILRWLVSRGQTINGLVVHPKHKAKYRDEIIASVPATTPIWEGYELRDRKRLEAIRALAPDLILSVLFGYILKPELMDIAPRGAINLHNGYLPYNAGSYANVWSIVDRTPAGATIHYMDSGIDSGDIIARSEVPVDPADTGETIYKKVERAQIALFKSTWPSILDGSANREQQTVGTRTYHTVADVSRIDEIKLDQQYSARKLLDILRARTFPPHRGAYFVENGRKYNVSISIEEIE
jgi:methionyl-tRNA formyltransferase